MRYGYQASFVAAMVLANGFLWALVGQAADPPAKTAASERIATATSDQQLATVLYHCNLNEVEIAKFAHSRLKSDDVKEFSATLIKDHQSGAAKFQKLAGAGAATSTREGEPRAESGTRTTTRVAAPAAAHGGLDWVRIQQEIGKKCVTSTKDALAEYEGSGFDHAFLGQQIDGHMKAVDELKVFSDYASPELKPDIESALKTTQAHLKEARRLMDQQKKDKKEKD